MRRAASLSGISDIAALATWRTLGVSVVASFALLVQLLLALPLAERMAAAAWLDDAPICAAADAGSGGVPHGAPGGPGSRHDHAHCVLCQGHAPPMAAGGVVLPPAAMADRGTAAPVGRAAAALPGRRIAGYASRGPPAAG